MIDYKITLQQEVLREMASGIHAAYCRYMEEMKIGIEQKDNVVRILADRVAELINIDLYQCKDMAAISIFEGRLRELRKILEEIIEHDK